mgnify:CR=1 FL=1
METILDIGMLVRKAKYSADQRVGIIKDLQEWGYDQEADMLVVEYYVLWNTGETFMYYEWDLEVIDESANRDT